MQYSAGQYSTVYYSTVQYSTLQYNTIIGIVLQYMYFILHFTSSCSSLSSPNIFHFAFFSCLFFSSNRPIQLNSSSTNDWTSTVTTVDLSDLQLHKLSYIDQLLNLKWLCLQNNSLTTTEVSILYY